MFIFNTIFNLQNDCFKKYFFTLCALLFCLQSHATQQAQSFQAELLQIDQMDQDFKQAFYKLLLAKNANITSKFTDIEALKIAVDGFAKEPIQRIKLIEINLNLINDNYDHPDVYFFIKMLLDNNSLAAAKSIITNIEEQADMTTIVHSHYLLANFYFQRHQWENTLKYLQEDGSNLTTDVYQHRLLIKGYALQKLSKHRQAQKTYKKIPTDSEYYYTAQFNIALANLRQGWWSEAHDIIKTLSKQEKIKGNENALNRLYITLGYSLLNKGYYRNANNTFQKVEIDSYYSDQALLGIALTAAQQDDYLSALSASRILKNRSRDNLPIDESYLLMPFFYEKSQQWMTASTGYLEASHYYQKKIALISKKIKQPINLLKHPITMTDRIEVNIDTINIDFSANYPEYFFVNNQTLSPYKSLITTLNNKNLTLKFNKLQNAYSQLIQSMVTEILNLKRDSLNSYLDQTRYGLARLFDNNTDNK